MRGTTAPGPSTTVGEKDLPPLFRASDHRALRRQSDTFWATRVQLLTLLLATGAATIADRFSNTATATAACVLYALTVLIEVRSTNRHSRAQWQANRDAAEALKSLAWQYMVHGGPFHSAVPDPDALFTERLEERLRELRKVGWRIPQPWGTAAAGGRDPAMSSGQITRVMREVRAKPFAARRDIYLRDRLLEQLVWHRNRALQAHRAAVRWSAATAVLTLLALATAVLKVMGIAAQWDLSGLLSAGAAAGVAWQEMRRHRPLAYAYRLIKQDLETLRIALGTSVTEQRWSQAVADAERLVLPSHTDWLVRFGN